MDSSDFVSNAGRLLADARVKVSPETFSVVSLTVDQWSDVLQKPELSPGVGSPFMIFKDQWEVTLVIQEADAGKLRDDIEGVPEESGFRLISFDADLDFEVIGFMAVITKILATAGISVLPFSSFARDHVLVKQDKLASALKALRGHVKEVC